MKQMTMEVDRSDNIYKAIFENSIDAIFIATSDGRIQSANSAACRMFDYTEKEIIKIGRNGILDLSDERLPALLKEREQTGKFSGEIRHKRKDGTVFPAEITSTVFKVEKGKEHTITIVRDTSARKLLENKLAESEKNQRALIDAIDDALFLIDTDGTILLANNRLAENFGKKLEDIVGTDTYKLVPEDVAAGRKKMAEKAVSEGCPVAFTDKRGERYIENRVFPIMDETGKVTRLAIFGRDITLQKEAEMLLTTSNEALKKSEEKFRMLVNLSPAGIYMTDEDGKCTFVNESWCRMAGVEPEEAYGDGWINAIHPNDRSHVFKLWEVYVNSGKEWNWSYRFIDKKGNIRWIYGLSKPVLNKEGKKNGFLGTNTDITERKKVETDRKLAEENLKQSEEKYRLLSDQSGVGVGLYSKDGIILYYNNKALKNLGGRLEDFVGKSLQKVFGEKDGNKYFKRVKEEIRLRKNLVFEDYYTSPTGNYWFASRHSLYSNSIGEVIGVQVVSHDITERKLIEAQLIQTTTELRELTRHLVEVREEERTAIARDLHDDLGQKLTALNMDISWLKSRIGVQSRNVENKLKQMVQMMNITIESVQKISFGLRPSILDDLGLIPAIEWQVTDFHKSSGLSCNFSCSPNNISVDAGISLAIFRIIQEALTNIARHSGATKVNIKISLTNGILEILIKDNGSGIEKEKIDSSESYGLIGMRERVRVVGGELSITGRKGEGTRVGVRIAVGEPGNGH